MKQPRVCLIGVGGYGRVHLRHLLEFHQRGALKLVAAVMFSPDSERDLLPELTAAACAVFPSFEELVTALPGLGAELAVVSTPIHLHARMTLLLLEAGLHVLVEKPIAATAAGTFAIRDRAVAVDRIVAVGFQYLHAPEILALKRGLLAGAIGPLRRVVVHAAWPRSHAYYTRNDWAGRLRVGDEAVFDSPVNNAISHFFMLMLFLGGRSIETAAEPISMSAELYRAQDIESFDTAVVRLEARDGGSFDFYATHSSRNVSRPSLRIEGEQGTAEWVQDSHAQLHGVGGHWYERAGPESTTREKMLADVLARISGMNAFVCTPELAALHVRCVAHLHARVLITPIPSAYLSHRSEKGQEYTFVQDLDRWLTLAAFDAKSLAEVGAPWGTIPTMISMR